jgi:hypothetical protein
MVVVVAMVVVVTVEVVDVAWAVVGTVEVVGSGADVVVGSTARLEHPADRVNVTTRRARRIARP